MTRRWQFVVLMLVAAGVALGLRIPKLNLRPMHGDEAVHAYKLNQLWQTGRYAYDPEEFHGPTLYYFTLPALWLSGAKDLAQIDAATLRMVPVLFGVGLILLLLLVADGLGRPASVAAALLMALSPALVFYSRYYIQETLLAFFTFATIAAGWRYACTQRVGWALLSGACLGLMHATKETCVIACACLAAAWLGTWIWRRQSEPEVAGFGPGSDDRWPAPDASRSPRSSGANVALIAGAVGVAVAVSALFFSGFLANPGGLLDSLRTYGIWFERAGSTHLHDHPWYYYLRTLLFAHYRGAPVWSEGLILALAAVGIVATLTRTEIAGARLPLLRFLSLYAVLMTAVYSAIPYKTPWCLVQFLYPLILLAGVGAVALFQWARVAAARTAIRVLLTVLAAHLGWQAYQASLNPRFCADQRNPYVYAQPVADVQRLAAWVDQLAAVHPDGRRMLIKVIAPNPWPLPWYLRGFERVGYWEQVPQDPGAPVVIVSDDLLAGLPPRFDDERRFQVSTYGLRPDVRLRVYVDRALYQRFADRIGSPR
jgi:uncharacterized protein (TIGR03663 family)